MDVEPHPWDLSTKEAVALQRRLATHVREEPLPCPPRTVAGVDVSVRGQLAQAAIVVLAAEDLTVVDRAVVCAEVPFPYVPGLLAFRELPVLLPALESLSVRPDVFVTDGHGLAHPRRFGLACHLGILLDAPTFGVAKKPYIGRFEEPDAGKGSRTALIDRVTGERIGTAVRTRDRVKPVFVSVGHRITLEEAVKLTLAFARGFRLPEMTRQAHLLSRRS